MSFYETCSICEGVFVREFMEDCYQSDDTVWPGCVEYDEDEIVCTDCLD